MRQVPQERDTNIAVNGCSGFATSTQKGPFMAMLISHSGGTYLIAFAQPRLLEYLVNCSTYGRFEYISEILIKNAIFWHPFLCHPPLYNSLWNRSESIERNRSSLARTSVSNSMLYVHPLKTVWLGKLIALHLVLIFFKKIFCSAELQDLLQTSKTHFLCAKWEKKQGIQIFQTEMGGQVSISGQ